MKPFVERIILHLIGLLGASSTLAVVCEAEIKNVAVQ